MNTKFLNLSLDKQQRIVNAAYKVFSQNIDTSIFNPDIDLKLMYQEIMYAVDGYMLNKYHSKNIIVKEIEKEMKELIEFWKKIYIRKENENNGTQKD